MENTTTLVLTLLALGAAFLAVTRAPKLVRVLAGLAALGFFIGAGAVWLRALSLTFQSPIVFGSSKPAIVVRAPQRQISAAEISQFLQSLGGLQGEVKVRISAPADRLAFRKQIVAMFELPYLLTVRTDFSERGYMQFDSSPYTAGRDYLTKTPRFGGFVIFGEKADSVAPTPNPDADATPSPPIRLPTETIFHAKPDNPNLPVLWTIWTNMGLQASRGYSLPSGSPPDLIYIQIGTGPLWR